MFGYLNPGPENITFGETVTDLSTWVGVGVAAIGFLIAYGLYARRSLEAIHEGVEKRVVLRFLHRLTNRKFYLDDLYYWLTRYVFLGIAHTASAFDTYIVDGLVNGTADLVTGIGN